MVGSLHLRELDAPPIFRLVLPFRFISLLFKASDNNVSVLYYVEMPPVICWGY